MSSLEDRTMDKLADMVIQVLWQDLLEVWNAIRAKMDSEGSEAVKSAFDGAVKRFVDGPFNNHVEVRWGMNLCVHCNDDNIEKNGIAYVKPDGDGLEFNHCLNCRIGILYDLETAKARLETYTIGLGDTAQFQGVSIYWNAIVPDSMKKFLPTYELIQDGQWLGTVSFDESFTLKFLPFDAMTESVSRDADAPWTTVIPRNVQAAIDAFLERAKFQVEAALAIR